MKNFSISRLVAELLPVAAFNTIYFILVENFTISRWIAWSCLHIAYLVLIVSGRQAKSAGGATVYGYPRIAAAWSMFLMVAIAFGIIFIVNPNSTKWPIIIEVVAVVAYLCLYFIINYASSSAKSAEAEFKQNMAFIRTCSDSLLIAKTAVEDSVSKKQIEKAYDAIRNGNAFSVPAARSVEYEISGIVNDIVEIATTGGDLNRVKELSKSVVRSMMKRENLIRNN